MTTSHDQSFEAVKAVDPTDGTLGALSTRLAKTQDEIEEAQRIRYQVFFEEMSARKSDVTSNLRRDNDSHDLNCDHLLVIDNTTTSESSETQPKIVGTQRFFVKNAQSSKGVFHSQPEFDLEGLSTRFPRLNFMELGRSCILSDYRNKRTMELMWHGTWAYAVHHKVDVMVGCASFEAEEFEQIAPSLGFLSENASCEPAWDTPPTSKSAIPLSNFKSDNANAKRALAGLPPLIKGYLRLGAKFASHAVADTDFGTIDILVILPVANINPRYVNYYGADASKHRTQAVDGGRG